MGELSSSVFCPALFIAAPSSGQGKTTITAALARYFRNQGKCVRVFKTGPDYLDPQILEQASGQPVEQLDMWMAGEAHCQQALYHAATTADLILVEGAMGLFDGDPSSADLASRFNIPIALLLDVKGTAQTAAAIALGLAHYRDDIQVAGLIANHCGSERHAQLIREALPDTIPLLAILGRDPNITLPERHLGLVQAEEVREELELRFEHAARELSRNAPIPLPLSVEFFPAKPSALMLSDQAKTKPLLNQIVGIARDAAFSFIYSANVQLLKELGADVVFFSPLQDICLPKVDAVWLPGGYPELHAKKLADNVSMMDSIRQFYLTGKPILAECGGFLYCLEFLVDLSEHEYPMLGLLPGYGAMRGKRGCQGMQTAVLPEGDVRGHAHHRSRSFDTLEPIGYGRRQRHSAPGESLYRNRGLTASYLHLYFPSNPEAVAALLLNPMIPAATSIKERTEHVQP